MAPLPLATAIPDAEALPPFLAPVAEADDACDFCGAAFDGFLPPVVVAALEEDADGSADASVDEVDGTAAATAAVTAVAAGAFAANVEMSLRCSMPARAVESSMRKGQGTSIVS